MTHFTDAGMKDDEAFYGPRAPVCDNGRISLPAKLELLCQASDTGKSVGGFGIVRLQLHNAPPQMAGFHSTLTPQGLRHFAAQCCAMAKDLEATAAQEAADLIDRAKASGK